MCTTRKNMFITKKKKKVKRNQHFFAIVGRPFSLRSPRDIHLHSTETDINFIDKPIHEDLLFFKYIKDIYNSIMGSHRLSSPEFRN